MWCRVLITSVYSLPCTLFIRVGLFLCYCFAYYCRIIIGFVFPHINNSSLFYLFVIFVISTTYLFELMFFELLTSKRLNILRLHLRHVIIISNYLRFYITTLHCLYVLVIIILAHLLLLELSHPTLCIFWLNKILLLWVALLCLWWWALCLNKLLLLLKMLIVLLDRLLWWKRINFFSILIMFFRLLWWLLVIIRIVFNIASSLLTFIVIDFRYLWILKILRI